jgi:hypothetical protein
MNTASLSIRTARIAIPPGEALDSLPTSIRNSLGAQSARRNVFVAKTRRISARVSYSPTIRMATKAETSGRPRAAHPDQLVEDWLSYLPRECVNAMVDRNWHHTTR